jgi:hypothetical protein
VDALRIAKFPGWVLLGFAIVAEKLRMVSPAFPDQRFAPLNNLTEATEISVAKDKLESDPNFPPLVFTFEQGVDGCDFCNKVRPSP